MTETVFKMMRARAALLKKNSWIPHFITGWILEPTKPSAVKWNKGRIQFWWNPDDIKMSDAELVKWIEEKAHSFCRATIIRGNVVKKLRERASLEEVKK